MSTETYRINFEDVKRAVSMEAVIGFLGLGGLKQKSARQWKGACPFCKGADCFVVTNDGGKDKTGAFNCFKCPAGGDQIELVSLVRGNTRKDGKGAYAAAKELHEKFLAVPKSKDSRGGSESGIEDEDGNGGGGGGRSNRSSNASPQPQRDRRPGFDPEAYAKSLDPGHEALASFGIDAETFRAWKSGYASAGVNRGRLALPVTAKDGSVIGYAGRALKDESPKLTFPNGLSPHEHIFGVDRVTAGHLTLVRDPIEVLRATEAGCGNVVCFLTEDITAAQLEILAAIMDERKCESLTFF